MLALVQLAAVGKAEQVLLNPISASSGNLDTLWWQSLDTLALESVPGYTAWWQCDCGRLTPEPVYEVDCCEDRAGDGAR